MEDSSDMHSEEDKGFLENKKRRLKTPNQVEALENLYDEHKYPSESIKLQLSKEIGLSEKQVSRWFCHRRLKEKMLLRDEVCAFGKQDLSMAVIQDRGSGLLQDSCGSTKQGEHMHFDPKEVQSKIFYSQNLGESSGQYMDARNHGSVDNTSSGSSSTSQARPLPWRGSLRYGSFEDEIENPAITAVKRQLGKHYREDGPLLGVDFEALPPGAFDSPIKDPIHEPYYVGDPILQNSCSIPRVRKEPYVDKACSKNRFYTYPPASYSEGEEFRRPMGRSDCDGKFVRHISTQNSTFTNHRYPAPERNSAKELDEYSGGKVSKFNSKNYGRCTKQSVVGSSDSTDHHIRLYDNDVFTNESSYLLRHDNDTRGQLYHRQEYLVAKPTNSVLRCSKSLDSADKLQFKRMKKEEKLHGEKRKKKNYNNPVRLKMLVKNETKAVKMGRRMEGEEFRDRDYVLKMPSPRELPWTRPIKGSGGDMPTSISEDEATGTSSSMD